VKNLFDFILNKISFSTTFTSSTNSKVIIINMNIRPLNIKSLISVLFVMVLGMYPLSGFSQSINDISIVITFENPPSEANAVKAPLKYNKKFALSMQIDDGNSSIYNYGYPFFEGGVVEGTTYPRMAYSDGCGNLHSFKMTSAVYIFSGVGTDLHNDPSNGFITWDQLDTLYQHNWGIANHGVNTDAFDIPEFINYSIGRNNSYVYRKMINSTPGGVHPKVFVNPNGNGNWSTPAFNLGSICALNEGSTVPFGDYGGDVNNIDWGQKYNLFRVNTGNVNVIELIDSVASASVEGANFWCPIYTHSIYDDYLFNDFTNDFNYIESKYGSTGTDEILMTTDEEILNYLMVRDAITVSSDLTGSELTVTFSGGLPSDLLYYASSTVINSNENITDIVVQGTTDFSFSETSDSTALVNFNFNEYVIPSSEELATNYTNIAVGSQTEYDALIAMDYVSVLEYGEVKNNLVDQLCAIFGEPPYDEGFCESGFPNFVTISGDSIILTGEVATLTATSFLNNYEWSNGQVTQSISVSPQTNTKYWVSAITQDMENVSDTIIVTVNDSYVLSHSPLSIAHVIGVSDSLWVTLKEGATSLWSTGSTLNYINVDPEVSTIYHLDVLLNNVIVNQLDFDVYIGNIVEFEYNVVCLGDTTTLINKSVGNDTISKVTWDLNGNTQFDDAEGDTVKYLFSESVDHLVGMRVYYKTDLVDVVYNAVPVGDMPNVDFEYANTCTGSTTLYTDLSTVNVGVLNDWLWYFGDGQTDANQNTSHQYSVPGNYTVKLVASSSIGCKDSIQKYVQINNEPNLTLKTSYDSIVGNNDTVYFTEGETVTILVTNYTSYDSVIWFDNGRSESVTIAEEGSYYVVVYDNTCSTQQNFYTSWGDDPVPPVGNDIMNLFTPNGDGYNDIWQINDPNVISPAKVNVYNRSGKQVYSSSNYQNNWDGQYLGNPLPQATYYYIIEDASGQILKGAITIIR
jgi:gliding motility-associated-like protein